MDVTERFCIFCLKILIENDFERVENVTKDILVDILPKTNFDSTNFVICRSCLKKSLVLFQFKSTCLSTEDVIFPYIDGANTSQLDLKEIYMQVNKNEMKPGNMDVDKNVCRLCMKLVTDQVVHLFDMELDVLKEFLPEMNFTIIRDPVVCKDCCDSLDSYTEFLTSCLGVEKRVDNLTLKHEDDTSPRNIYIKNEDIEMKDEPDGPIKNEQDCDSSETRQQLSHKDGCEFKTETQPISIPHNLELGDPTEALMYASSEQDESKLKAFVCNKCSYVTRFRCSLKKHQLRHSNLRIYECDECRYKAKTRDNLKCHKLTHRDLSEVEIYKCNVCDYRTKHKRTLWSHMSKHDTSDLNLYKCNKCSFVSRFASMLKTHQNKHSDLRMYECDKCEYKAKRRSNLMSHKLIHKDPSDVEIYKCDLCKFETKYKASLSCHMEKHDNSELNLYKCDKCSYATKGKGPLKKHKIKQHSRPEVKVYECNLCDYKPKSKQSLKQHTLTHMEMFKCEKCHFETKSRIGLKMHHVMHQLMHKDLSDATTSGCDQSDYELKYERVNGDQVKLERPLNVEDADVP